MHPLPDLVHWEAVSSLQGIAMAHQPHCQGALGSPLCFNYRNVRKQIQSCFKSEENTEILGCLFSLVMGLSCQMVESADFPLNRDRDEGWNMEMAGTERAWQMLLLFYWLLFHSIVTD